MANSILSKNDDLARVLGIVKDYLRDKGTESGANIGHMLRREIPGFSAVALGFTSLSQLLLEAADEMVIVGRKGDDRIWALGEGVSDRDIEHALAADLESAEEPTPDVGPLVTRVEFVNFRSCRDVKLDLAASGLTVNP